MTKITEVPSPFCGIGSDDLEVEVDGSNIKVIANGCAVTTPAFEEAVTDTAIQVAGRPATMDQAVARAAELLRQADRPLIGGCATDVAGMRALLAVADKCCAAVDNINFSSARRNILAMQDSGWMTTTLAEVKNRCDYLLAVGVDPESFAPRFFERYLWNDGAMYLDDVDNRRVVFLGKPPSATAATSPSGSAPKVLTCSDADLPEVLAVLSALVRGQSLSAEKVGGIALAELRTIAAELQAARYGVVTWAAGALDFAHAELAVQTICNIVKEINSRGTRCSGLPLGGKEGDQTANQVCGWITGYPARVDFKKTYPEYDPFLFDAETMLTQGEADVLLWVHAFNSQASPPPATCPTIVLGRPGMALQQPPDVFIPIGTPGIDHAGHAYRLDNVVAIRLKKLRDSGLPSSADVLAAIEQAL